MEDYKEKLDLVNQNDEVIGTVTRKDIDGLENGYVRAAEMLIINDMGEIWVPRRSLNKKLKPGGLDYSCAGHVASGETYDQALRREVEEELNLKLDDSKLQFLHKFAPRPDLPPYFRAMYIYRTNDVPSYNHEDFIGYEWLTPQALLSKLKAGEPAKDSLIETLEYLIEHTQSQ